MNYEKIQKKIDQFSENFSIDRKKIKTVSFSQFSLFQGCNHRWKLIYVDKAPKQKPNINLFFGTAVHNTIQYYLTIYKKEGHKIANSLIIEDIFEDELIKAYKKLKIQFPGEKITTQEELDIFFPQGVDICYAVINDKNQIFGDFRYINLVGCEIPLFTELTNNVFFEGYIDLVFYNEAINKFLIFDLKTSTKGWSEYEKKDKKKIGQLLLYKKIFSKIFNVPLENIMVIFTILKREVKNNKDIVENFGLISNKKECDEIFYDLIEFVEESFDEDGNKLTNKKIKNKSKMSCMFCHFKETTFCP